MEKRLILFSVLAILLIIALAAIIISNINHPPTAEAKSLTTREDTPISITIAGSDRDGDTLTYAVITEPTHGSLSGTEPNLTYSPDTNYNGTDSFSFKVNDGKYDSDIKTVSITVTAVNDPPTANDDSVTAQEDVPIVTIDVPANDTDNDNDRLVVVNATQGNNGTVTINTDSSLTYAPARNFCGTDTFNYTISDGKGGSDTATVNVTIESVNDTPSITSKPVETARVWTPYTYDVDAKDPDAGDWLTFSLIKNPEGMTIVPSTGLIEWRPTSSQAGTHEVQVKVADSYRIRASDSQTFDVTVTSLSSPLKTTLTVINTFSQKGKVKVSAKDKVPAVQSSDNDRFETESLSYTCYEFCDESIPPGASIISAVVYVEHFEETQFISRKLQWSVGTGWPEKPEDWGSISAPVRQGESNEATDSWDVTSYVDTPQKANSLVLQVSNNDTSARRKTSVDYVYAVVQWY